MTFQKNALLTSSGKFLVNFFKSLSMLYHLNQQKKEDKETIFKKYYKYK